MHSDGGQLGLQLGPNEHVNRQTSCIDHHWSLLLKSGISCGIPCVTAGSNTLQQHWNEEQVGYTKKA